jgi:hypothetical protein
MFALAAPIVAAMGDPFLRHGAAVVEVPPL